MTRILSALIVDDHAVVREGGSKALQLRIQCRVHHAASKAEALAQIAHINPELIIIDINLPDGNGLEIVSWARSLSKSIAIVVLSFNESDEYVLASMKAGASAFVQKSAPLNELMASIDHALASPRSFTARNIASALSRQGDRFGLSQRELQILSQLHRGCPLKELAHDNFIAESTLKTHLSKIYRKLGVKNRVQAIELAKKSGLIE